MQPLCPKRARPAPRASLSCAQPIAWVRPHVFTAWAVLAAGLLETGATHSGYACLRAQYHDKHHEAFRYNFGAFWMDAIFGTRWEASPAAAGARAAGGAKGQAKAAPGAKGKARGGARALVTVRAD